MVISYIESKTHGKILKIEVLLPFMPIQPNYHCSQTQIHATVLLNSVFSSQHVFLFKVVFGPTEPMSLVLLRKSVDEFLERYS